MNKKYSIFSGNISRIHPIAAIAFVAFILVFLSSGIFRVISVILFVIAFFFFIGLKIQRRTAFNKQE